MKWIDVDIWPRKPLIDKYSTYVFPYINIGADLDVTKLFIMLSHREFHFYCAMIYGATKAALSVENF